MSNISSAKDEQEKEFEKDEKLPDFSDPAVVRAFWQRQYEATVDEIEAFERFQAESLANAWGHVIV